jgi:hypothetical protein
MRIYLGVNCLVLHNLLNHMAAFVFNPLNAQLNPICRFPALLGAHPILHVSRIRVNDVDLYFSTYFFLFLFVGPILICIVVYTYNGLLLFIINLYQQMHIYTVYYSLTYLLTYLVTPWSRVLIEKLTG